jgi:hypothetical protein
VVAKIEELQLSPRELILVDLPPHARNLTTGVFRETLQHVPAQSEVRRFGGALRAIAAGAQGISKAEITREHTLGPEEVPIRSERSGLVHKVRWNRSCLGDFKIRTLLLDVSFHCFGMELQRE